MTEKAEIEEEVGKRFAQLPEHMQSEDDVPAFLRNRKNGLGKGLGEIMQTGQAAAARAAGRDVTASDFRGSFAEACPACGEAHHDVAVIRSDDDKNLFQCPKTFRSIISTPTGLELNPFEVDTAEVPIDMNDRVLKRTIGGDVGNRHLAAQMNVERAVRAPIKSSYSAPVFDIIRSARKRLTDVERRKDDLRKLIEVSQNELASLTTESDLLRDTIGRFEASSEDDKTKDVAVEDQPTQRRRRRGGDSKLTPAGADEEG